RPPRPPPSPSTTLFGPRRGCPDVDAQVRETVLAGRHFAPRLLGQFARFECKYALLGAHRLARAVVVGGRMFGGPRGWRSSRPQGDRKSTRLNSSHVKIS